MICEKMVFPGFMATPFVYRKESDHIIKPCSNRLQHNPPVNDCSDLSYNNFRFQQPDTSGTQNLIYEGRAIGELSFVSP